VERVSNCLDCCALLSAPYRSIVPPSTSPCTPPTPLHHNVNVGRYRSLLVLDRARRYYYRPSPSPTPPQSSFYHAPHSWTPILVSRLSARFPRLRSTVSPALYTHLVDNTIPYQSCRCPPTQRIRQYSSQSCRLSSKRMSMSSILTARPHYLYLLLSGLGGQ